MPWRVWSLCARGEHPCAFASSPPLHSLQQAQRRSSQRLLIKPTPKQWSAPPLAQARTPSCPCRRGCARPRPGVWLPMSNPAETWSVKGHSAHTHDHTSHKLDVLIPCASGEKRPAFEYKDGLWSWGHFDELVMREPGAPQEPVQGTKDLPQVDWAIVLRDLCVIDCDTPEVSCAGLEVSTRPDDRQPPLPRPRHTASLSSKPRSKPRAHLPPHHPRPKPSPTPV